MYKKDWDHYLPIILLAYRTLKQSTTQFEPFYLTYGRQVITPFDLSLKVPDNSKLTLEQQIVQRACSIIDKVEFD